MAKKKSYVEGGFYWARKTWGEDRSPEIVCCEDPGDGGKFRRWNGQWGGSDTYEILSGPLTYEAPVEPVKMKLNKLPKNDGRWEPAGWWCAAEVYGRHKVPTEIARGDFYLLELPEYTVKIIVDDLAGDHFTALPEDMYQWCVASLKGWWSAIDAAQRGRNYVAFSNEADFMLFKLKWL